MPSRVTQPEGQPPLGKYPSQPLPEAPGTTKTPGFKPSAVAAAEPEAEDAGDGEGAATE